MKTIIFLAKTAAFMILIFASVLLGALAYIFATDTADPHPMWSLICSIASVASFFGAMACTMWSDVFGPDTNETKTA